MALQIERLTVRFGETRAVDDLDLDVPDGAVLALLGPSGSGKSTLLRAVAGLVAPTSGRVCWDGDDLGVVPVHRRGFALMFQDGQLFDHQSVARNVGYALRLQRRPRAAVATRVRELLQLVGLPEAGERSPRTLSGGERQRVALARALAVDPRLLLLDEPLSALDRDLREQLAVQVRQILTTAGTTTMMVTHDQEEAFAVADRIAVMRAGRLVQSGSAEEVWRAPADAWTARFLGYATVLEGEQARRVTGHADPVALRRSALRLDEHGPIAATVRSATTGPEQTRVVVEVEHLGRLDAVASPGVAVPLGERVRVSLDTSRMATLPAPPRHP